ncbi:MAG: hypothetical protein ASUL_07719 [Candidatus Aramenus sulfurataquae]|uniref:Uncharacterized protein n=2 Tax=Candidatus Aramenus sulfurataquae TaxID=1326980 RepID=W7KW23_9CREN|nr:MAG: hypothetical protein ASUL_07719 [Candidatus Aramenus sulfurataquae]
MNGNLVFLGIVLLIAGAVLYFYYAPHIYYEEVVSEVKQQQFYGYNGYLLPEGQNFTISFSSTHSLTLIAFNTSPSVKVVYPAPLYSTSETILDKKSKVIVESGSGKVIFINNSSGPAELNYLERSIPTPSTVYYSTAEVLFAFGAISIVAGYLQRGSTKGKGAKPKRSNSK